MERQTCGTAEERFDPRRILQARQLNQDTVWPLPHGGGFGDARFIYPAADDFQALIGRSFIACGNVRGGRSERDDLALLDDFDCRPAIAAETRREGGKRTIGMRRVRTSFEMNGDGTCPYFCG